MNQETTVTPAGFAGLGLTEKALAAVAHLGFEAPTPIQSQAIPEALSGRDLIGIAQTGTGKTLAFGLPVLERLLEKPGQSLVLAPTRELALQIDETLRKLANHLGMRTAVLIGGAPMNRQVDSLRRRPQIIVATPGRLLDHVMQRTIRLDRVDTLVLDEADRMLDMGFWPAIKQILEKLPETRQTLLFSATMPKEIEDLARSAMRDPSRIEVAPAGTAAELVSQELFVTPFEQKGEVLDQLLREHPGTVLVFSRTRHGARKVAKFVRDLGHSAAELHSDLTLAQRRNALEGFKNGRVRVLVATDIAARGIDVKQISLVVNYDLPDNPEDYVHRIGRTGRAGETGRAITIATPEQGREVRDIERLLRREIPLAAGSLEEFNRGRHAPRRGNPQRRPHTPHAQAGGNRGPAHNGHANSGHANSGHGNGGHGNGGRPLARRRG